MTCTRRGGGGGAGGAGGGAVRVVVILALGVPATARAGDGPATRAPERPDDPRVIVAPEARRTSPAFRAVRGEFASVQVNVDAEGRNVVGDAANEPSIAVSPRDPNRVAIGWRQFDTIQSNFRQAGIGYSRDAGRTWTAPPPLDAGNFRSDPVLASNAEGAFYYYSLRTGFFCDMFISTNGGRTFAPPIPAFGGDKAWFTIDTTDSRGRGNVYAAWSIFGNPFDPDQFARSTDGTTWKTLVRLPDPRPRWGTLAVAGDGTLYVSGWVSSGSFRVLTSSNAQNAGETPTFERNVAVDLGGAISVSRGPNPGGLLGQAWVATDRSGGANDGNVYLLCSVDPPGDDPLDVAFARSEDGGLTWSDPVRVNDDPEGTDAWQWFGTMAVAPDGRIDAIWNDTRGSVFSNISELYYAFSVDGGRTWSRNVPLSPSFDSWLGWPDQNKIGDYYDLVSDVVGASLAWSATFNGEQDVYYLRIGDFDCNGNEIGDADDIAGGGSPDRNENGIPDECECPADVDRSGVVDSADLVALLAAWGECDDACPADVDRNGVVDVADLLEVLRAWGPCFGASRYPATT